MIRSKEEITNEMLTIIKSSLPYVNVEWPSNVNYLCDRLAENLAASYLELHDLTLKYNIKHEDLNGLTYQLGKLTLIPSEVVSKVMGER